MTVPLMRQGYYPSDDDYYIILDVDQNAPQETIAQAYRNLARKFHPDKNNHDERSRKEAQAIFEKIKTAYDVLSDPYKRRIYDTVGTDGLKKVGWQLVSKQLTAQEIRDEYLRLQQKQVEDRIALIAKPRASFTIALDASSLFSRSPEEDDDDDDDVLEEKSKIWTIPTIEISSMSASMAVQNTLSKSNTMTLGGDLNLRNGTGDGTLTTTFRYKYSPATQFDLSYLFGRSLLKAGVRHQLTNKTTLETHGLLIIQDYSISPVAKLTLGHRIRDNLVGQVSYKESATSSVTTSLVYINQKLLLEVTTSYKLCHLYHQIGVEVGHRFNSDKSKLSVALNVQSNQGVAVEYGCETTVLEINVIGAAISFSVSAGVTLKLLFNRGNQAFSVPIFLSDEVHSAPIFYGTIVPLVAFYLLDRYYLKQFKQIR